jgi:hypothetical protein
MDEFF